jgi:NDP-hexose-3-ketoreductase
VIKISVLACSSIAKRSVIPAIIQSERFKLTHIASREPAKAQECAKQFNCEFCSYDDLLQTNDDAVYVSLPVGLHFEWVMKLLKAGKHVLVEKTFVDDLEKAKEIIQFAEEKKLIAMEALVYLYHPLHRQVLDLINAGEIGNIQHIEACFGFPFLPDTDIRNKFEIGGGAMLDALIYPLSFSLELMKHASLYSYFGRIVREQKQPVDSKGFLQLNWDDVVAQIAYGFGFSYRNNYKIWGSLGQLTAERVFSRPPTLTGDITVTRQDGTKFFHIEPADQFKSMVSDFADKIQSKSKEFKNVNVSDNIIERLNIISNLRQHYINASCSNTDVYKVLGKV